LWSLAHGRRLLKGTADGVLKDQGPMLASYEVHCDENRLTHRVHVESTIGSDVKTLSQSVENRGVALHVSHHTRISQRGGEKLFLLTSLCLENTS
jgi:hypothetical protein